MMNKFAAALAALLALGGLSACGQIQGVSTAGATNAQGSLGTAADTATGGQGDNQHEGDVH